MKKLLTYFVFFALFSTSASAASQDDIFSRYDGMSAKELIVKANKFYYARTQRADSALVCFSVVANRLENADKPAERELLCEAYLGLWTTYFFTYFDYDKAFSYLAKAKKAAVGIDYMTTRVYFSYGNIYQTLATQWGDQGFARKAIDNYVRAFNSGCRIKSREIVNLAFSNLIPIMWKQGSFDRMKAMWKPYRRCMETGENHVEIDCSDMLYKGYLAMYEGRNDDAIGIFKRQIAMFGDNVRLFRLKFNAYENLALAYSRAGLYHDAVETVKTIERWAIAGDMKDGKLEVYQLMQEYLAKAGEEKEADDYRRQYYMLKDSMQNYQRVMSVGEMEFLGKIDAANKKIDDMRQRQRASLYIIIGVAFFALFISVSLFVVYRKNRQLKQANRVLYKKNTEVQAVEDQLRELHRKNSSTRTDAAGVEDGESQTAASPTKYRNSMLSEDDKDAIMKRIVEVMEDSSEIFSPDFSINRLAELAGSNYKRISQVINEKTGGNFNTFVNEYRIKEACRKIDSRKFANYTIEALANSVGFKSRTSFFTSFKHHTGLSPSEYIRIAKERL